MKPGTIDWQSPDMVPLFEDSDVIVAHVCPTRGRVVEQGIFDGRGFYQPDSGLELESVRAWAMMPDFPDGADMADEPMG